MNAIIALNPNILKNFGIKTQLNVKKTNANVVCIIFFEGSFLKKSLLCEIFSNPVVTLLILLIKFNVAKINKIIVDNMLSVDKLT